MNKIVGVVGMCGAGKSKVTDFFEAKGWNKVYFGGVTMDELKKRGILVNEQNERSIREELRRDYGPAAYAILLEEKIRKFAEKTNVVLDGLYSWDEYLHLKEAFGDQLTILAIVTNRDIRYNRLSSRPIRPLSAADALKRDVAEIENIAKGGPIAIADYYIDNNGGEEALRRQLENFCNTF